MANEWTDKAYGGGAVATTLNGGINGVVTSVTVTSGANLLLDGSTGPYVITVDRTTLAASEEKMLVTARSGNVLTVQRGYDGTAAVAHNTLASVEHIMDAYSIDQANAMAAAASANGSMAYRSAAFAYSQLAIGTNGLPIVSNGSIPQYAALGVAGLSAAVQALLVPPGATMHTIAAAAPSGWLMMDGSTTVGADVLYPALWAIIPASWKSGTSLVLPDARGRAIIGAGTGSGLTARALSSLVGAESVTLTSAQSGLPTHTPTGSVAATGFQSADHIHNVNGNTNNQNADHQHQPNAGDSGFLYANSTPSSFNLLGGAPAAGQSIVLYATNSVLTGTVNQNHQHFLNINSQGVSANHNHAAGALTMNAVPAADAVSSHANMQPSLALNTMIKAH